MDGDSKQRLADQVTGFTYGGKTFDFRHADPEDHIFNEIRKTGTFYEIELLRALSAFVKPHDLVVDVGANIGNHTLFFAGVFDCHVVAFEPNPQASTLLTENVARNGVALRVRIEEAALGAYPGRAEFIAPRLAHNLGASELKRASLGAVEIKRLDDFSFPAPVRIIKIDVEGMELEVLQGAAALLERDRPVIAAEAPTRQGFDRIADYLAELGYVVAGSYNYTPTHVFTAVADAASRQAIAPIARGLAAQYIEQTSALSQTRTRLRAVESKIGDIGAAQAERLHQEQRLVSASEAMQLRIEDLRRAQTEESAQSSLKSQALADETQKIAARLNGDVSAMREDVGALVKSIAALGEAMSAQSALGADLQALTALVGGRLPLLEGALADLRKSVEAAGDAQGAAQAAWIARQERAAGEHAERAARDAAALREQIDRALAEREAAQAERVSAGLAALGEQLAARQAKGIEDMFRALAERDGAHAEATARNFALLRAAIAGEADRRQEDLEHALAERDLRQQEQAARDLVGLREALGAQAGQRQAELARALRQDLTTLREDLAADAVTARASLFDAVKDAATAHIREIALRQDDVIEALRAESEAQAIKHEDLTTGLSEGFANTRRMLTLQAEAGALRDREIAGLGAALAELAEANARREHDLSGLGAALAELTAFSRAAGASADRQIAGLGAAVAALTEANARRERGLSELGAALEDIAASSRAAAARAEEAALAARAAIETQLLAAAAQEAEAAHHAKTTTTAVLRAVTDVTAATVDTSLEGGVERLAGVLANQSAAAEIELEARFALLHEALGLRPPPPHAEPKKQAAPPAKRDAGDMAKVELAAPKRVWQVRAFGAVAEKPPAAPAPSPALKPAPAPSGELLAADAYAQAWKDRAWTQGAARLAAGGAVLIDRDGDGAGFVSRQISAPGGGLLEVVVDIADVGRGPGDIVLRLRNDADEALGPDYPLAGGRNVCRFFAQARTKRLKLYIVGHGVKAGRQFAVRGAEVRRVAAADHRGPVSARIGAPVIASLASIPKRRAALRDCVDSLLLQCDRVRVFLNEYPDVPDFLRHERIDVRRSQDWDDRGDAGKVFWIGEADAPGYRIIADDDLIFPPDFAETMAGKVKAMGDRAIYATHAVLIKQPLTDYYSDTSRAATFHFGRALAEDRAAHIGATNALCFHSSALNLRWADFKYCNSADIWLSLHAQRQNIPILTPARRRGWVRENTLEDKSETIYGHSTRKSRSRFDSSLVQTAVLRHFGRLTTQKSDRAKLVFALVAADAKRAAASLKSWAETRAAAHDWVVIIAAPADDPAVAQALRAIKIEHETHEIVWSGSAAEAGLEAFALGRSVGAHAGVIATDGVMFDGAGWESAAWPATRQTGDKAEAKLEPIGAAASVLAWREGGWAGLAGTAAGTIRAAPPAGRAASGLKAALPPAAKTAPSPPRRTLSSFCERVQVINLDRRADRWAAMQRQLVKAGLNAERVSAVDGRDPAVAAEYQAYAATPLARVSADMAPIRYSEDFYMRYASQNARVAHVEQKTGKKAIESAGAWAYLKTYDAILEKALADQVETLLVFDDDVLLHDRADEIFAAAVEKLPADWQILQLGTLQYNWNKPWAEWQGENLYRTNGSAVGSHAVIMRFDVIPYLLDQVRRMTLPYDTGPLSAAVRAHAQQSFVIYPNVAIQALEDSDINSSAFQASRSRAEIAQTYRWTLADYSR